MPSGAWYSIIPPSTDGLLLMLHNWMIQPTPCQLLNQSVKGKIISAQCSMPTHIAIKIFTGTPLNQLHPTFQSTVVSIDVLKVKSTFPHSLSFCVNQCFQNSIQMCGNNIVLGQSIGFGINHMPSLAFNSQSDIKDRHHKISQKNKK